MRAWVLLFALLLSGCLSATVAVEYDAELRPVSCHASYWSLGRDVEGAAFRICGGEASIKQASAADALRLALEAALRGALR